MTERTPEQTIQIILDSLAKTRERFTVNKNANQPRRPGSRHAKQGRPAARSSRPKQPIQSATKAAEKAKVAAKTRSR
jgi:hypothetical protein